MIKHRIPASIIAPVIRQWIANDPAHRTLCSLGEMADVAPHILEKVNQGTRLSVEFYAADRLLTRMGRNHLWYTDLADYYPCAGLDAEEAFDDELDEDDETGYAVEPKSALPISLPHAI